MRSGKSWQPARKTVLCQHAVCDDHVVHDSDDNNTVVTMRIRRNSTQDERAHLFNKRINCIIASHICNKPTIHSYKEEATSQKPPNLHEISLVSLTFQPRVLCANRGKEANGTSTTQPRTGPPPKANTGPQNRSGCCLDLQKTAT